MKKLIFLLSFLSITVKAQVSPIEANTNQMLAGTARSPYFVTPFMLGKWSPGIGTNFGGSGSSANALTNFDTRSWTNVGANVHANGAIDAGGNIVSAGQFTGNGAGLSNAVNIAAGSGMIITPSALFRTFTLAVAAGAGGSNVFHVAGSPSVYTIIATNNTYMLGVSGDNGATYSFWVSDNGNIHTVSQLIMEGKAGGGLQMTYLDNVGQLGTVGSLAAGESIRVDGPGTGFEPFNTRIVPNEGSIDQSSNTGSLSLANLVASVSGTLYRVTGSAVVNTGATSGTLIVTITGSTAGGANSQSTLAVTITGNGTIVPFVFCVPMDSGAIQFSTTFAGVAGPLDYGIRMVAEKLQ